MTSASASGPDSKVESKLALITGATSGIGRVTAATLTARGFRVVVVGRDPQRTAQLASEIGAEGHLIADLSELAQVRRAADEFRERWNRLDVLINNAGAIYQRRQETSEGHEKTWALNYLSPFLLTHELMSLLLVTPGSRVVTVASMAHAAGRLNLADPEFRDGNMLRWAGGWAAYNQSKLATILFARELARRGAGVQSYSLHPGVVASGFGQNEAGWLRRAYQVIDRFAISPTQGAQTSLYLASTPDPLPNGGYFSDCRPATPSPQALDDGLAARLWDYSEQVIRPYASGKNWPA